MPLIPLTRGLFATVSPADYPELSETKWHAWKNRAGATYAMARKGKAMARVVMQRKLGRGLLAREQVDHKNLDTLDNRRSNLRLASNKQNSCNKKPHRDGSSKYKGVSWHRSSGTWEVRISCGNERKHLGYFHDEKMAAKAYDGAAKYLHGRFARLNFPPCV